MSNKSRTNLKTVGLLCATLALSASGNAWSLALEQPLGDDYYSLTHAPRIDMTNIDLNYTGWRAGQASRLTGVSTGATTLTLIDPSSSATTFTGSFSLNARVTPNGVLKGGKFSFTSSDAMFGFGKTCENGENGEKGSCTANAGVVFKGRVNSFGWSESKGMIEFGTSNFNGWACRQGWCTSSERLYFNMNNGSLGLAPGAFNFKPWSNTASGTAVIPVPAAVWLFGSGLVGLAGFATRKKKV